MATILVTGGTGLIGAEAVRTLAARGADVHVVARHALPSGLASLATGHVADVRDPGSVRSVLADVRPSHLLHMAWVTAHGQFWNAPDNLDWQVASLHLVRQFAEAGGRRVVMAGTCAEYDWTHPGLATGLCREKETPVRPATLYGQIKDATRREIAGFCDQAGLSMAWGRIFWLFGAREDERRLVGSIIARLSTGQPAPCSQGTQVRDFLAVEDLGEAFAALALSDVTGPVNLASGTGISVGDLALLIGRLMGRPDLVHLGALPMRVDDPPHLVADISRLRREVGFAPALGLEERMEMCISAWPRR